IGSPADDRTEARFARVVGLFANLVALRFRVSPESGFVDLVRQVRQTVIDAQSHQGYPLSLLVERLQPERDFSRSPLFQATFTLDRTHWFISLPGSDEA